MFRPKDLKGWWANAHHDRPGGVRAAEPTAWVPGMKPVRLTEFGCPAVDRGANAPNLFQDPKSAEGSLPPWSTGGRDDRMQRRALEAVLNHFAAPENNPVSAVYDGRMLEAADAWCWDARPWPAFPGRAEVWADAPAWRTGHWLNGRLGGETRDLIAAILRRGGLGEEDFEVATPAGEVQGYVIDRPMRTRDALEPLLSGLGLAACERGGRVAVVGDEAAGLTLEPAALALPDRGAGVRAERVLEARPGAARVRFIDGNADYQTGSAVVRADGEGGGIDLDLPAVCPRVLAEAAATRLLESEEPARLTVAPGPLEALRLEAGDAVAVAGRPGGWRVMRLDMDETPSAMLAPISSVGVAADDGSPAPGEPAAAAGAPFFRMLDLPPMIGAEGDGRPVAVVAAEPWRPMQVFAGADPDSLTPRAEVERPATVGTLVAPLGPGPRHRWDRTGVLDVQVEGTAPGSRSATAVLGGANAVFVETGLGWEVVQFRQAELVGPETWRLTGLLRGQQGTEAAMQAGAAAGAVVVFAEPELVRADSPTAERGLSLMWRAGPAAGPAGGAAVSGTVFAPEGLHARPWSPAHLRVRPGGGGVVLSWIPRNRVDGDRWNGEAAPADPLRFQVTLWNAGVVVRRREVEGLEIVYAAAELAADFPGGLSAAEAGVAQWGEGYGWGVEARVPLA